MAKKPDPFLIDDENPEWTKKFSKESRPASEMHPKLVEAFAVAKMGRPPKPNRKQPISIRLDPDLIAVLRTIPGHNAKLNALVRNAVARHSRILFGDNA